MTALDTKYRILYSISRVREEKAGGNKLGGSTMEWEMIVAIVIAVPFIVLPVSLVWYLNTTGIYAVVKDRIAKRSRSAQIRVRKA